MATRWFFIFLLCILSINYISSMDHTPKRVFDRCNTTSDCRNIPSTNCAGNMCVCSGSKEYDRNCYSLLDLTRTHKCLSDNHCKANDYHSKCNASMKCECSNGYTFNWSDRKCVDPNNPQRTCKLDKECEEIDENMKCINGRCVCKDSLSEEDNRCRIRPVDLTYSCKLDLQCKLADENSYCSDDSKTPDVKKCLCNPGFNLTSMVNYNHCTIVRTPLNANCTTDEECQHSDPNSRCSNGLPRVCFCPKGRNTKTHKCNTAIGSALANSTLIFVLAFLVYYSNDYKIN